MGNYKRMATPDGIRYVHRVVMERTLGRRLLPGEVVHHINHDTYDNRPENLTVTTAADHLAAHRAEHPDNYRKGGHRNRPRKYTPKPCAQCGTTFQPRVETNLCCSVSCAQTRRYARIAGVL